MEMVAKFDELPENVLVNIFSLLDLDDFGAIFLVNKKLNEVAKNNLLWKTMYQTTNWTVPLSKNDKVIFNMLKKGVEPLNSIQELVKGEEKDIIHQNNYQLLSAKNFWYSFFILRFSTELETGGSDENLDDDDDEEQDGDEYDDEYEYEVEEYIEEDRGSVEEHEADDDESEEEDALKIEHILSETRNNGVSFLETINKHFSEIATHFNRSDSVLMDFITEPKRIIELVDYLFHQKLSQKVENFILKILTADMLCSIYFTEENPTILNYIFSHIEKDFKGDKNDSFSQSFPLLIESLFLYSPPQFVEYSQANKNLLYNLIFNLREHPKFFELLLKITEIADRTHSWLTSANFIPLLLEFLGSLNGVDEENETCDYILEILHCLAQFPESEIVADFFSNSNILNSLLDYILSASSPPASPENLTHEYRIEIGVKIFLSMSSLISDSIVDPPLLIQQLLLPPALPFFTHILFNNKSRYFGNTRLALIELFSGLLITGYSLVYEVFINEKIFDALFNLFFTYPWNNILHHHLYQIFCCLSFACADGQYVLSVLESNQLPDKIVDAFANESSLTVGYLSFLQKISNDLIDQAQHSAAISTLLENNEKWMEFMDKLEALNNLEPANPFASTENYEEEEEEAYEYEYHVEEDDQ